MSALLRKSLRDLTRRRARTVFTVMTLALAVASVGIFGLPPLMDRAMRREVAVNRLADVTISMKPVALSDRDLTALARIPGVAAVEPASTFRTRVYVGERRAEVLLVGVRDFARRRVNVVAVPSGRAPGAGEVLTDVQNARRDRYAGRVGDVARVTASDGTVRRLSITGTGRNLEGGQQVTSEDAVVLYATTPTVAALRGKAGYDGLALRLRDRDPQTADAVVAAVRRRLGATPGFAGLTALPAVRAPGDWPGRQELDDFSTIFSIVTFLALVSALVLVSSTMTTLVSEQAGEIATMKAIGARRRQIVGIYARTSLLLGALATAIGSVLGVILANALVRFFGSRFFAIEPGFGVDAGIVVAGCAVGLLGPPLAALPAVWRGSRVSVREALQQAGPSLSRNRLEGVVRRAGFLGRTAQIGLTSVGRRARRSLATTLQIALAVATMLGILGLGSGIAATVHGSWSDHAWAVWVGSGDRPFDARAARIVRSVPGVAEAEGIVEGEAQLRGEPAYTWGVAPRTLLRYRIGEGRWYGAAEDRAAARVTVIERNLARATGTRVGDRVLVSTPGGRVTLRVIGIADNQQEEGTVLFVPRTTARTLAGLAGASTSFWVRTRSADHPAIDRVATRVEDALVSHGYATGNEITYVAERDEAAAYRTISTSIAVLGFLVIAISLVGLVNTITMNVLERTREIGVLRCIGARGRDVRRVFAFEGLALVLAGWLAGVPLGYALDRFLVWLVRESVNAEVDFAFPAWHVPLALVGTLALALTVMSLPVRRAVRFRPGDALRYA